MADLSREKRRDEMQLEKIGRRDSVIPDRLGVRAPDFRPSQDMRSARRGDVGGAEALMKTLGVVEKGASDFADYSKNQYAVTEDQNIQKGLADQQLGTVDPAMQEKSLGYSNAVLLGRTTTEFQKAWSDFQPELGAFIEQQTDPDINVRRAQVQAKVDGFYHNFAIDPETGQTRDYLQSPAAMRYVAGEIGKQRPKLNAETNQRIEERFNTEALTHYSDNIVSQALSTGKVDLAQALPMLPPSVPPEARSKYTANALSMASNELFKQHRYAEGVALLDSALGTAPHADTPVDPAAAPASLAAPAADPKPAAPAAKAPTPGRVSFDVLANAVGFQESRHNPNAVSKKGAVGTMQTMPFTLRDPGFGVRPAKDGSPAELERVGKDYLRACLKKFDGSVPMALAAYNAGPNLMQDWVDGTNKTGKNPNKLVLPDPRQKGVSIQQFVDAIPFKETKGYVANITGNVGLAPSSLGTGGSVTDPEDPVKATPGFRLMHPQADPITAYEQQGKVEPLNGADKIMFLPEDRARLQEMRNQMADKGRAEWKQKTNDEQNYQVGSLLMRAYGQGDPLTSVDVTQAVERGEIRPEQGVTLYGILRSNASARQSYSDRQLSLHDRAEAKAQEAAIANIGGGVVKRILNGDLKPGDAMGELATTVGRIKDPKVQIGVVNMVMGVAGDKENMVTSSQPVRDAGRRFFDREVQYTDLVRPSDAPKVNALFNQMQADYATRIKQGDKPEEAEAAVVTRWKPKLDALVPKPKPKPTRPTPASAKDGG